MIVINLIQPLTGCVVNGEPGSPTYPFLAIVAVTNCELDMLAIVWSVFSFCPV